MSSFFKVIMAIVGVALTMGVAPVRAAPVDIFGSAVGTVGGSDVFRADASSFLNGSTLTITLVDDNDLTGGSTGVFSGFDLDTVFLSFNSDPNQLVGEKIFASSLSFQAGTTRPPGPNQGTTAEVPGPVYGADNATTIDAIQSTLNTIDGVVTDNVFDANSGPLGFLTFGDGGTLIASFSGIVGAGTLYLFVAEVGGGEFLLAEVAPVPLPGAVWLFLTGLMALIGFSRRRKIAST